MPCYSLWVRTGDARYVRVPPGIFAANRRERVSKDSTLTTKVKHCTDCLHSCSLRLDSSCHQNVSPLFAYNCICMLFFYWTCEFVRKGSKTLSTRVQPHYPRIIIRNSTHCLRIMSCLQILHAMQNWQETSPLFQESQHPICVSVTARILSTCPLQLLRTIPYLLIHHTNPSIFVSAMGMLGHYRTCP